MAKNVIHASHVFKSYGKLCAVCDVSFDVPSGTVFSFLGPNGAGKTTLMKILYGKALRDRRPESQVSVFGFDPVKHSLEIKNQTGVVPQEDNLDVELNVLQNLLVYARFYAIPVTEAVHRIEKLLSFMELSDKRRARIRELSGGMKRRLLIVRALLGNPKLLILDEPTTGLDPQVRQLIWDRIRALKARGVSVLLTTHYMEEAFQLADTILIMDKGRNVLEGNPARLLEREIESYVLEVTDKKALTRITARPGGKIRREDAGERVLFYSNNITGLKRMSSALPPGSTYLRQANLEDLFLKITGRNLNAVQ